MQSRLPLLVSTPAIPIFLESGNGSWDSSKWLCDSMRHECPSYIPQDLASSVPGDQLPTAIIYATFSETWKGCSVPVRKDKSSGELTFWKLADPSDRLSQSPGLSFPWQAVMFQVFHSGGAWSDACPSLLWWREWEWPPSYVWIFGSQLVELFRKNLGVMAFVGGGVSLGWGVSFDVLKDSCHSQCTLPTFCLWIMMWTHSCSYHHTVVPPSWT